MIDSQLAEALRALSGAEFKEFGKFVSSPYFNNRDEITRFYNALKKFYPRFDSDKFTKQNLFSKVYKTKRYSDVLMRKLISLMINLILDYLRISQNKNSILENDVKLLEILRVRKMLNLYTRKQKKVVEAIKNTPHDISLYELQYKADSSLNGVSLINSEKEMLRVFQKEHDDFVSYFLGFVLIQYIRLTEWSKIYNMNFDLKLFDEVTGYLSKNKHEDFPLIMLYYNMLMLLKTGGQKYFDELSADSIKYRGKIANIHSYNIALVLIQYCYQKISNGFTEYSVKQFELTKSIIENNLIPQGYIEPYFFTNAVRNASFLKETEWVTVFIEKHKNMLNPENRDEILNYSYAMLEFNRNDFNASLKYLSSINIEQANMKYDMKNIRALNYYELGYTEELISHIDTYKHFLSRDDKRTEQFKEKNKYFLKCVLNLAKLKENFNAVELEMLKKEIENAEYFSHKEWLLEKANELLTIN